MNIGISKNKTIPQKIHLLIILLLSIIFLVISSRFLWTGHLHTYALDLTLSDQIGYVTTARNIAEQGKYESNVYYPGKIPYYKDHNLLYMPGNYYVRAAFFYLFGYSVFTAILPNLLSYIGSVILLFLIAQKFFGIKAAYVTVFLFMLFPLFVVYSFTAMQEMLFVFTCLLSFYLFIKMPQKVRYFLGGLTLLIPFLIRESAAFMMLGFATMIYFENKDKRFLKIIVFVLTSLTLLLLVYSLPQIRNKVPFTWGKLTPYGFEFYDFFTLGKNLITFVDLAKIILSHFLKNVITFIYLLTVWPWRMGFAFFMIIFALFLVCTILLFLNKSINKAFLSFSVTVSIPTCLSMFSLYYFQVYTGARMLLFLLPFFLCIISYILVSGRLLKTKSFTAILLSIIFLINIFSLWESLRKFGNEFADVDVYALICTDFLNSVGVSNANYFVGPYKISLDYVNEYYPIKYCFVPGNEILLKLVADKFPVDILIIPSDHNLVYVKPSDKIKTTLLGDRFIMTEKKMFMNNTYLIFKQNPKRLLTK